MRLPTKMVHTGVQEADPHFGSVVPPIYTSSTFTFTDAAEGARRFAGKEYGMIYSRFTNPTVDALNKRLADLEGADMAISTASGMAAITTVMLHHLKEGDTLLAHNVLYGGAVELIARILPRYGITTKLIDFTKPGEIEKNIDPTVKLLYFETPTNPMLEIVDIKAVTYIAKKNKIVSVMDNTFAPPPLQYPIELGVDIVIHSLTKYLGGHADVIGGAIIGKKDLITDIMMKTFIFLGPALSPFTAYLVLRGMTTLSVRVAAISNSGLQVARYLEQHKAVTHVYYPGLSSHPQYTLAAQQMSGFGGVISFEVEGGYTQAEKIANTIELFSLAVSLGGVESLIEHPASMTHSELTESELKAAGIRPGLLRIAVGLEDTQDLIDALKNALEG